jgi:hypothetical protein
MSYLFRTFLLATTVLMLTSCGFTKDKEIAVQAVETFHKQFDASKFEEIYSGASPAFKASTTKSDFIKFVQAIQRKLGAFKGDTANGWRTNVTTSGTFVTLSYKSEFANGPAEENFIFVISGNSAVLQNYNINSMALITN